MKWSPNERPTCCLYLYLFKNHVVGSKPEISYIFNISDGKVKFSENRSGSKEVKLWRGLALKSSTDFQNLLVLVKKTIIIIHIWNWEKRTIQISAQLLRMRIKLRLRRFISIWLISIIFSWRLNADAKQHRAMDGIKMLIPFFAFFFTIIALIVTDGAVVSTPESEIINPRYLNYEELTTKLRNLSNFYPNTSYLRTIGNSVQKRHLWVLEVST